MPLTFLITSGPTREYLDPVRFLSNASSGRMGLALADAAVKRGHRVVFVTGPAEAPRPAKAAVIEVVSAEDMFREVKRRMRGADIIIGAAAVADYRPASVQRHKIKKGTGAVTLKLVPTTDILRYAGAHARKGERIIAGFCLESNNLIAAARKKLAGKNLDLIVANPPGTIGAARSAAWLISPGTAKPRRIAGSKAAVAGRIIDETLRIWKDRRPA